MKRPSGPTLLFLSAALLAALAGFTYRTDAVFAGTMEHWTLAAVTTALAFYVVLDCGIGRHSRK